MIGFSTAWGELEIGAAVQVTNGAAAPNEDPETLEHRIWRSHNFSGVVAEKIDGPVRQLRIESENEAGNVVGFVVAEGDGHSFTPSVLSPELAMELRWTAAKAYSDDRAAGGFQLEDVGTIQTDPASREAIRTLVDEARDRLAAGETSWSTAFVNEENVPVPVTAMQILAIYAAVRGFLGACYTARQNTRNELGTALASGATAEQILSIDITAGYPA